MLLSGVSLDDCNCYWLILAVLRKLLYPFQMVTNYIQAKQTIFYAYSLDSFRGHRNQQSPISDLSLERLDCVLFTVLKSLPCAKWPWAISAYSVSVLHERCFCVNNASASSGGSAVSFLLPGKWLWKRMQRSLGRQVLCLLLWFHHCIYSVALLSHWQRLKVENAQGCSVSCWMESKPSWLMMGKQLGMK